MVEVVGCLFVFGEEKQQRAGSYDDHDEGAGNPKGAVKVRFVFDDLAEDGTQQNGGFNAFVDVLFLNVEVFPA